MSQQKVDNYKKEKYNRKNAPKQSKVKSILSYVIVTLVAIALLVYLGYSIAVSTGLYTPETTAETTTYQSSVTAEDLRKQLIQKGDTNVKGNTETTEETTTVEESTTE